MMIRFNEGDIIKPIYSSDSLIEARVVSVHPTSNKMTIIIQDHKDEFQIGRIIHSMNAEWFELVEQMDIIEFREEEYGTFITINNKYTIFTKLAKDEISLINIQDIKPNIETAKLLALSNTK